MEKKINGFIKKIIIDENVFCKLNELIEEKCVNSGVVVVCDFLSYKKYEKELEEIKQKSLNDLKVVVLNFNQFNYKGERLICEFLNETYDLIVGIGEFKLLKFVENFAIKTNICYAFVNLFELKSELFCKILRKNKERGKYFPPYFVLTNKKGLLESEKFNIKLNIIKYYYLFLEYILKSENDKNLKDFLNEYKNILYKLTEAKDEEFINLVIGFGLLLNKFSIIFFVPYNLMCIDEYRLFLLSTNLILVYYQIFNKINANNLYFSRCYKYNTNKLVEFSCFDFDFNKFILISNKNKVLKVCRNLKKCFEIFCEVLKSTSLQCFYNFTKKSFSGLFEEILSNKKDLFLNILENFEISSFKI